MLKAFATFQTMPMRGTKTLQRIWKWRLSVGYKVRIPFNMSPSPTLPKNWYLSVHVWSNPVLVHVYNTALHPGAEICVPWGGSSSWKTSGITVLVLNNGSTNYAEVRLDSLTEHKLGQVPVSLFICFYQKCYWGIRKSLLTEELLNWI